MLLKGIGKPYFKRAKKFRTDMVGLHMLRPVVELNRPIQVGAAILDLSKVLMYDFHYNIWMKTFPNSKLLFTDTDSLAYEVTDHNLNAGLEAIKEHFDFSEYPDDHPLKSDDNLKVIGKFKDECFGQLMLKFVGLRPKLYTYEYEKLVHILLNEFGDQEYVNKPTDKTTSKIIVVNKNVGKGTKDSVRNLLSSDDYKKCLTSLEPVKKKMRTIRSDHHNVYTYEMNKIALSAFDDKRWILEDGVSTLAYGHYKTHLVA